MPSHALLFRRERLSVRVARGVELGDRARDRLRLGFCWASTTACRATRCPSAAFLFRFLSALAVFLSSPSIGSQAASGMPFAISSGVVPSSALPCWMCELRNVSGKPGSTASIHRLDLAQLDGHRVEVDAVRCSARPPAGAHAGTRRPRASRSPGAARRAPRAVRAAASKKVSRAAGRVDDGQARAAPRPAFAGFVAMVSAMTGSSALSSSTCTRLSGV